ncbi:MAG: biotin/lipoyl-binding protein [Oscillospiraceae bacterium]|nr:biotin/lipoyl-binding protein [Oscillospiraceae bacterium]
MKYKITLNDKTYEVIVEKGQAILADEYDAMAPAAAAPVAAAPVAAAPAAPAAAPAGPVTGEPVTAPLPGTVVSVKVTAGQAVKSGELLAVIEAMKMENEVLSPRDGTVAQIVAAQGTAVKTGDPLVTLA